MGEPVYADHYVLKDSMKEESSGEEDLMTKEGWRSTSTTKVGEVVEYLPEAALELRVEPSYLVF